MEELLWQYQLPPNLSRAWLEESRFTLLLDGLDEVQAGVRDACIEAINTFLADYPAEVVVCSRHQDYEQLQQRLNLRNALLIQTLTPEQIDTYLAQFGPYTTPLRHTIQHHPTWQTLATSPLMLNLMLLTYTDPDTPPPDLNNPHQQRHHLFNHYLHRVFQHRPLPAKSAYDQAQARHWLTYLAYNLQKHRQTIFYIGHLQPTWLSLPRQQRQYSQLDGLSVGLIFGLSFGLSLSLIFGLSVGLSAGLIFGLNFGLSLRQDEFGQLDEPQMQMQSNQDNASARQNVLKTGLRVGLRFGLLGGLLGGLIFGLIGGLIFGPVEGLIFGLSVGLSFGLSFGLRTGPEELGGRTVIQHYILRYLLARQGVLPYPFSARKLVAYLDAMTARMLLRRVGGGWVFIHRYLLEHLAALYNPEHG